MKKSRRNRAGLGCRGGIISSLSKISGGKAFCGEDDGLGLGELASVPVMGRGKDEASLPFTGYWAAHRGADAPMGTGNGLQNHAKLGRGVRQCRRKRKGHG